MMSLPPGFNAAALFGQYWDFVVYLGTITAVFAAYRLYRHCIKGV